MSSGGWAPLSSWYGTGMNVPGPYFRISFFGWLR